MAYQDGTFIFDDWKDGRWAKRFAYDSSWRRGKKYRNVNLVKHSWTEGKGLTVSVFVVRIK